MSQATREVPSNPKPPLPIVVAVSGGSGAVYTRRLLQVLAKAGYKIHLLLSTAGNEVVQQELGLRLNVQTPDLQEWLGLDSQTASQIHFHQLHDFFAPVASGSYRTGGMVICPCSGGTLSAVAHGTSSNLIQRAAEVHLKERRKLILVPRETPLSHVAMKNMLAAHEAGAVVMPASPGWYHGVQTLDDLVDFMVARILDQLEIDHNIIRPWGAE